MHKLLTFVLLTGATLTSCGTINETMYAIQRNREAIDMSTCAINENAQAVQEATRGIEENRRQLEEINKALKKAGE